jgi:hypothetical protein
MHSHSKGRSARGGTVLGDRSKVGTPSLRTGEDVFPLLEIVSRVPRAAAFFPSLIDRNRLGRLPTLTLPSIEKHGDDGAAFEPPLKAPE